MSYFHKQLLFFPFPFLLGKPALWHSEVNLKYIITVLLIFVINYVSLYYIVSPGGHERDGWMEGNYLRLMPGLSIEDRTNWYASSRWRRVIWSVLAGRLWSTRTFQQELKGRWWDLVWIATGRGKSPGLLEEDRWPFILSSILSPGINLR